MLSDSLGAWHEGDCGPGRRKVSVSARAGGGESGTSTGSGAQGLDSCYFTALVIYYLTLKDLADPFGSRSTFCPLLSFFSLPSF